jgi:ABC-2 type transport system permease protein
VPRFRILWGSRRILKLLVSRDLKVKYADSVLGYFWTILEPLMMAGVYWFIFSVLITRALGEDPYIVFLLAAMLPWQWANSSLRGSMRSLNKDSKLVRSTNLPREIWVLRTVGSKGAEFVFSLPVLAFFAVINHAELSWYVVYFPLAMLIQGVLLVGAGLVLAPLSVLYGDVERLMRIVIRLLFYFSPIIYGIQDVQTRFGDIEGWEWVGDLFVLNPFAGIFDLYRAAFFPDQWAGWDAVGVSAGWAVALLAIGVVVFRRLEGTVLKEI